MLKHVFYEMPMIMCCPVHKIAYGLVFCMQAF